MTYDANRVLDARIPVTVGELRLDTCAYEYGQSVTNIYSRSEEFDHSDWPKINGSVTSNVIKSPAGDLTVDKFIPNLSATNGRLDKSVTSLVSGTFYSESFYIKKADLRYTFVWLNDGAGNGYVVEVDFDTGTIRTTYTLPSGKYESFKYALEDVGEGFYRVSLTAKTLTATIIQFRLYVSDIPHTSEGFGTAAYTGDGTSGVYIWGGQFVLGNKAGHYVKTTTAAATGSCDATDGKANIAPYSEDLTNWVNFNVTIIANDYNNLIDLDKQNSNGVFTYDSSSEEISLLNSTGYRASFYAKQDDTLFSRCGIFNSSLSSWEGYVDITWSAGTPTVTPASGASSVKVEIESDGVYRISFYVTTSSNVEAETIELHLHPDRNITSKGWWVGGMQVVKGDKAGIYYKTEAAAHTGTVGIECYNTYKTCEDIPNYTKHFKNYRFYQPVSNWPIGETGYPCLKGQPRFTPCEIDPKGSFGKRGVVSFKCEDFADDDLFTDNYQSTRSYTPENQGTFFRKLKARNPYYKGRLMKVRQGYIGDTFSFDDFEDRLYVIESIDIDQKGMVKITGKDLLKLAADKKSVGPAVSTGTLSAIYTAGVSTTLVLQTGEGTDYDTDPYTGSAISAGVPGYVRIGDNVLKYTGVSTDTLTGVVGGQNGSTDDDAEIDDGVDQCLNFNNVNVVDIIHFLLTTYAGISETYIPYDAGLTTPTGTDDEWDTEKITWLSGNNLTHLITKPTGVTKLVENICKQNLIYMWFDERDREVKLRAIAPTFRNEVPPTLTDDSHIIKDSIKTKDNDKNRISQTWVYYDQIDITGDIEKPENYRKLKIQVDTASENVNAYSEKAIRIIYADWLGSASAGLILTLAGRLLSRYAGTPEIITFKVDHKDADFWTGNLALLDSLAFQGVDGANSLKKIQMMKVKDDHDSQILELTAESWDYSDNRYGYITPDSMGDYTAETDLNRQAYGFICQNDGLYTNDDIGHLIA